MIVGGLDFETTGFVEKDHRIIEACLTQYKVDLAQPEVHKEISSKTWRINPQRSVPAKSFEVHGISAADLVGQPLFEEVAPELVRACDECDIIVAHNGLGFDFEFLIMELDRVGHEIPDFIPFDTMVDGRWATPMGEVPSLQRLCFSCGVEYNPEEAHAAKYDVDKMMECFFYGLAHGWYKVDLEA